MESTLKFVHLVAVSVWIGGMFFAHFCLRPAAFELLVPAQRLPLMVGALGRFFRWVMLTQELIPLMRQLHLVIQPQPSKVSTAK